MGRSSAVPLYEEETKTAAQSLPAAGSPALHGKKRKEGPGERPL